MTLNGLLWAIIISGIALIVRGAQPFIIIFWPIYLYRSYKHLDKHRTDDGVNLFIIALFAGIIFIVLHIVALFVG